MTLCWISEERVGIAGYERYRDTRSDIRWLYRIKVSFFVSGVKGTRRAGPGTSTANTW